MTAVRRDDEAGEKIIAVSRVVYERVIIVPAPSPTHSIPSKPTEDPTIPTPDEPIRYPNDGIGSVIVAVLGLTVLGCFALFLIMNARRHPPEREPLIRRPLPQSLLPTAAPARHRAVDIPPPYSYCIAPHSYDACLPADHEINLPRQPHPPITAPATPPLH
ncbi:hypothetical protein FS837_001179 [Tulasnella sp. UAMH 9824]|nr:hypothetical protein FS837_001179 [Tulasnella sp. UAMH 9824]